MKFSWLTTVDSRPRLPSSRASQAPANPPPRIRMPPRASRSATPPFYHRGGGAGSGGRDRERCDEVMAAANEWVDHVVVTGVGHARNLAVVASGDAVMAVGGAGHPVRDRRRARARPAGRGARPGLVSGGRGSRASAHAGGSGRARAPSRRGSSGLRVPQSSRSRHPACAFRRYAHRGWRVVLSVPHPGWG